ncbi:MAG: hypothetical protein A2Z11_00595 [Candidatus Woykebacteria bacterium RBG_16_43_9]|uniref:Uncharacterized protein n=1 Tax=Candidatus Woykebacteria bacterium RBG_16_43_9 TaxID=1802596 RepID=A0A1G1WEX1_9BACT|nr:MAG: hypothetical protein A2Z11_00595 [Candidatus Woykebacteria bacterium RBG_16_43_9]
MKISNSLTVKSLAVMWSSLKPILLIVLVSIILAASLAAYDQYQSYQERRFGAELIKNINVKSSCDEIASTGQQFNFEFSTSNKSNTEVTLQRIGIDVNIIGVKGKKFTKLIGTKPSSREDKEDLAQFKEYVFPVPVKIKPNDTKTISLVMKALGKKEARASSHTIVVYKGTVVFYFNYEMTIRSDCQIQVRYP